MTFWVYLLRCGDGSYYAGHSDNLEKRLGEHHAGMMCDWTRRRRPVALVWSEALATRDEAIAFERRIKGWTRAKKEALIAGDWARIGGLARPPHERPSTALRTNGEEKPSPTQSVRPEQQRAARSRRAFRMSLSFTALERLTP